MEAAVDELVMPGDSLSNVHSLKSVIIIGPGLRRCGETNNLLITKPGFLRFKSPNLYWIDCKHNKYIPKRGDLVVGVVARKVGDNFKVDIGAAEHAALSVFAFEGATKKQKPDLQVGDALYARVLSAHREMEPDLVCVDKYFKSNNLGKLSEGFVVHISASLTHRLLSAENQLLKTLGKKIVYEIAIGMNGSVWVNGKSSMDILKIINALDSANVHSNAVVNDMCRRL